ncbi:hypothetical protein A0U89_09135 [Kozakia baliensis]|uniref:Uncharacterized protein n=1 Tax=Kozakia baliensis TaxID=153496 RepID=A0A1D8UUE8_9PROT|nr:hypothetical protein [Kozakia baliensis]AOX17270.1 hypothetical protein A0U89_09135 [Kozakia baliensis]
MKNRALGGQKWVISVCQRHSDKAQTTTSASEAAQPPSHRAGVPIIASPDVTAAPGAAANLIPSRENGSEAFVSSSGDISATCSAPISFSSLVFFSPSPPIVQL